MTKGTPFEVPSSPRNHFYYSAKADALRQQKEWESQGYHVDGPRELRIGGKRAWELVV